MSGNTYVSKAKAAVLEGISLKELNRRIAAGWIKLDDCPCISAGMVDLDSLSEPARRKAQEKYRLVGTYLNRQGAFASRILRYMVGETDMYMVRTELASLRKAEKEMMAYLRDEHEQVGRLCKGT
jgi:hypothetical protein